MEWSRGMSRVVAAGHCLGAASGCPLQVGRACCIAFPPVHAAAATQWQSAANSCYMMLALRSQGRH
eukprot:9905455-Prorocentrum_lima.AAC.1